VRVCAPKRLFNRPQESAISEGCAMAVFAAIALSSFDSLFDVDAFRSY
jgi:hypothetical protein